MWLLQVKSDHTEEMEREKEKSEKLHRASGAQVEEGNPIASLTRDRPEEASAVVVVAVAVVVVVVEVVAVVVVVAAAVVAATVIVEGWSVVVVEQAVGQ